MLPYCFIIRRMSAYCFSTWFTSCTVVPLPRAMRLRRLPSIRLSFGALGGGHRIDDGFGGFQLLFVDLRVLRNFRERADLRQHAHQLLDRAHLANLLQLIAEIARA